MSIAFESFCYCFSLQTGTMVVGIFSLLTGIGGLALPIIINTLSCETPLDNTTFSVNITDDVAESLLGISEKVSELMNSTWFIMSSVLTIFFAIFVLIAAWKNRKHRFLLPWLILNPLPMIFGIGFTIYYAVTYWAEEEIARFGILSASAIGVIGISCWFVILSYYLRLRQLHKNAEEYSSNGYTTITQADDGNVKTLSRDLIVG